VQQEVKCDCHKFVNNGYICIVEFAEGSKQSSSKLCNDAIAGRERKAPISRPRIWYVAVCKGCSTTQEIVKGGCVEQLRDGY
jgi:hypothetical protein